MAQPATTTKACPDCAEEILVAARVCKHCGYRFDVDRPRDVSHIVDSEDAPFKTIGKSRFWLGLFSLGVFGSLYLPWYDLNPAIGPDRTTQATSDAFEALKIGPAVLVIFALVSFALSLFIRPRRLSRRTDNWASMVGVLALVMAIYVVFRWIKIPGDFATSQALKEAFPGVNVFKGGRDVGMGVCAFCCLFVSVAAWSVDDLYQKAGREVRKSVYESGGLEALPDLNEALRETERQVSELATTAADRDDVKTGDAITLAKQSYKKAMASIDNDYRFLKETPELEQRFDACRKKLYEQERAVRARTTERAT